MRIHNDMATKLLAFTGAGCAVLAQSDAVPPEVRITAGAIAAGCTAVLALQRQVGTPPPNPPGVR